MFRALVMASGRDGLSNLVSAGGKMKEVADESTRRVGRNDVLTQQPTRSKLQDGLAQYVAAKGRVAAFVVEGGEIGLSHEPIPKPTPNKNSPTKPVAMPHRARVPAPAFPADEEDEAEDEPEEDNEDEEYDNHAGKRKTWGTIVSRTKKPSPPKIKIALTV